MSTPRRRWFKVADKLGHDPIPNDELATWIRILALLNSRRARDLKDGDEVNEVLVSRAELARLAGCEQRARAERTVRALEARGWCALDARGAHYAIRAGNFADFQDLASGGREISARRIPAPTPTPTPTPISGEEKSRRAPPPAPPGRPRADQGTRPPDRLTDQERAELRTWALTKAPTLLGRLVELEEACLDYFRAQAGARGRKASWPLTVRTWIRTEAERESRRVNGAALAPRSTAPKITPEEYLAKEEVVVKPFDYEADRRRRHSQGGGLL